MASLLEDLTLSKKIKRCDLFSFSLLFCVLSASVSPALSTELSESELKAERNFNASLQYLGRKLGYQESPVKKAFETLQNAYVVKKSYLQTGLLIAENSSYSVDKSFSSIEGDSISYQEISRFTKTNYMPNATENTLPLHIGGNLATVLGKGSTFYTRDDYYGFQVIFNRSATKVKSVLSGGGENIPLDRGQEDFCENKDYLNGKLLIVGNRPWETSLKDVQGIDSAEFVDSLDFKKPTSNPKNFHHHQFNNDEFTYFAKNNAGRFKTIIIDWTRFDYIGKNVNFENFDILLSEDGMLIIPVTQCRLDIGNISQETAQEFCKNILPKAFISKFIVKHSEMTNNFTLGLDLLQSDREGLLDQMMKMDPYIIFASKKGPREEVRGIDKNSKRIEQNIRSVATIKSASSGGGENIPLDREQEEFIQETITSEKDSLIHKREVEQYLKDANNFLKTCKEAILQSINVHLKCQHTSPKTDLVEAFNADREGVMEVTNVFKNKFFSDNLFSYFEKLVSIQDIDDDEIFAKVKKIEDDNEHEKLSTYRHIEGWKKHQSTRNNFPYLMKGLKIIDTLNPETGLIMLILDQENNCANGLNGRLFYNLIQVLEGKISNSNFVILTSSSSF